MGWGGEEEKEEALLRGRGGEGGGFGRLGGDGTESVEEERLGVAGWGLEVKG